MKLKLFATITELTAALVIMPTRVPFDIRIYAMKPLIPTSPIVQ
jgi:hypothetical protein